MTAVSPRAIVAIDWSGSITAERRHVWVAVVIDGELVRLDDGHRRTDVPAILRAITDEVGPRVAVGLDFAFGLPAWFARSHGCVAGPDVWAVARTSGEVWLRDCDPPFWGRPGRRRPHTNPANGMRATDAAARRIGSTAPKSVFQVGGAGAVGTGSIRGMPVLADLRAAGFAIWPFDAPTWPVVVEIYPRHFTGPVVKSDPTARAAWLTDEWPNLPARFRDTACRSDDAFDAAVAARGMWAFREALGSLPAIDDPVARLEGMIWDPMAPPPAGR
ncbi:MAG: DUF429 domain-containing protein [Chloroflexi bacterium]|jgi:hypothetical protein|nr:DUF429 domain-containing protein [Chloroflexota bacterium]